MWVDAEFRVEFLVSLLFPDRLNVNSVLMGQIPFLVRCHAEKQIKKSAVIPTAGKIKALSDGYEFIPDFYACYQATVNNASRCSTVPRTHGGAARSDLVMVDEFRSPSHIHSIILYTVSYIYINYITSCSRK